MPLALQIILRRTQYILRRKQHTYLYISLMTMKRFFSTVGWCKLTVLNSFNSHKLFRQRAIVIRSPRVSVSGNPK